MASFRRVAGWRENGGQAGAERKNFFFVCDGDFVKAGWCRLVGVATLGGGHSAVYAATGQDQYDALTGGAVRSGGKPLGESGRGPNGTRLQTFFFGFCCASPRLSLLSLPRPLARSSKMFSLVTRASAVRSAVPAATAAPAVVAATRGYAAAAAKGKAKKEAAPAAHKIKVLDTSVCQG